MSTSELLSQLEKLEHGLDNFSLSELKTTEASKLKKSFETFKNGLEEKVFGEEINTNHEVVDDKQDVASLASDAHHLIANVSHEIRTPLNGIVGFLDLLKETSLSVKQQQLVYAMDNASKNLLGVTNELLEFSDLESGRDKFQNVSFSIKQLVNQVSFLAKTLINKDSVTFSVVYDNQIPEHLMGDPSKLTQILLNLIGNAIKFVEKGTIRLDVGLKQEKRNGVFVTFVISDTGIGIAQDNLQYIFESYRQAEPNTKLKYGGSGLGLSIVKQIVDKYKGSMTVRSTLGKGTTFNVVLPFKKVSKSTLDTPKSKIEASINISGKSVLVIEDDSLTQKLMENRLSQWGCKTYLSDNGVVGLQLLKTHTIDVILLDMHLPQSDGKLVLQQIKRNTLFNKIPVIVLSGDAYAIEQEKYNDFGIADFILKPYSSNELLRKIHLHTNEECKGFSKSAKKTNAADHHRVNLAPVFKECLGKTDLLEELLQLFEQNIVEFVGKTKEHLKRKNFKGIAFAAHKIRTSLKMLKLDGLSLLCENIRKECQEEQDIVVVNALFKRFTQEYAKVDPIIKREFKKIKNKSPK